MTSRRVAVTTLLLLTAARLTNGQPVPNDGPSAAPSTPGPVERAIAALERLRLFDPENDPPDGLALRVGSIDAAGRLAIGPVWRSTVNRARIETSAAVSLKGDREVAAGLHLPRVWTDRLEFAFTASATELPRGYFYGLGPDSQRSHRNTFESGRRAVRTAVIFRPAAPVAVEASTGLLSTDLRNLGGLEFVGADFDFLHSRLAVSFDNRDRRANPHRGGRYALSVERFAGPEQEWTSFNRVETQVEQNVGLGRPGHTLTGRVMASFSNADEGHVVPFYLMPTLGGSRVMRGFDHDRFRDRHSVVLQGEYAWDVTGTLGLVMFYERGAVAPRLSAFTWSSMRSDYGVGLRIGLSRFVALRTDIAFGSGEGTRVALSLNHGF
jgi:Omp85 superfamily domain